ncbi:hypothetical protein B0T17DRAFT_511753 [Bombardia bombarda]|uniref:Uncharacterized protein n=1 Tax=Bombardia bombarda TaxID=252184 RepID=A0AA39U7A4_9PEZI|nr:hypothetical protein B0T17DRAFT_511753 [Bombardia bombarda]
MFNAGLGWPGLAWDLAERGKSAWVHVGRNARNLMPCFHNSSKTAPQQLRGVWIGRSWAAGVVLWPSATLCGLLPLFYRSRTGSSHAVLGMVLLFVYVTKIITGCAQKRSSRRVK